VDVAAGGSGDRPATAGGSGVGLDIGLFVLALVLGSACVFGGVLALQQHRENDRASAEQERYGDVLAAARGEVEAFVNVDYRNAQSIDAVASGATGDLAKQYDGSTTGVVRLLQRERSVMDGKVLWAGVVDVDTDSATVLAATTGTVANRSTRNQGVARYFRLRLDLEKVGERWLTSNVEFVR
jgi:Mce-associated membrane protein